MDYSWRVLTAQHDIERYFSRFVPYLVVDTETVSTTDTPKDVFNHITANVVDVQVLAPDDKEVIIFSGEYAPLLTRISKDTTLVGHNFKYDLKVLFTSKQVDLLDYTWHDTMILDHLLNENRFSHSLSALLSSNDYGIEYQGYKDDFWAKYSSYLDAPKNERYAYGAADVYYTREIYKWQLKRLSN